MNNEALTFEEIKDILVEKIRDLKDPDDLLWRIGSIFLAMAEEYGYDAVELMQGIKDADQRIAYAGEA